MLRINARFAPFLFALAFPVAGCDSGPKLYPVRGVVKFADGTPLAGGSIEIRALDPTQKGINARSDIAPDGSFSLRTTVGTAVRDGAVVGKHAVIVIPPFDTRGSVSGQEDVKPLLHPDMGKYEKSGIEIEVKPETNKIDVTVRAP